MKKLFLIPLMIVFVNALISGGYSESAEPAKVRTIELKFAGQLPEPTYQHTTCTRWAKELEKRSNGTVKVTMYHGGSLVTAPDLAKSLLDGVIDLALFDTTWTAPGTFPISELFIIPFILPSQVVAQNVFQSLYFQGLHTDFKDYKVLSINPTETNDFGFSKKKVTKPEDFKGMKIRSVDPPVISFLKKFGASPVSVMTGEIFTAMERGVVDGYYMGATTILPFGFCEVIKYSLEDQFGNCTHVFLMNKNAWSRLPKNIQAIINELNHEFQYWWVRAVDEAVKKNLDVAASKFGVQVYSFTPETRARFKKETRYLVDEWKEMAKGKGLPAEKILSEVEKLVNTYTHETLANMALK